MTVTASPLNTSASRSPYMKQFSSPLLGSSNGASLRKSLHRESMVSLGGRKSSKTLPRGFVLGPTGSESSGDSVFGLYGDLMNVENYDECEEAAAGGPAHHHQERSGRDIHRSGTVSTGDGLYLLRRRGRHTIIRRGRDGIYTGQGRLVQGMVYTCSGGGVGTPSSGEVGTQYTQVRDG